MAAIKIEQFKGMIPRVEASLLPPGCAILAKNCRIKSGKLQPLFDSSAESGMVIRLENGLTSIAGAKTIYPWKRKVMVGGALTEVVEILAWPDVVDVCRGHIADDVYDRLIVSGKTGIPHSSGGNEPAIYYGNRELESSALGSVTRRTLVKEAMEAPKVRVAPVAEGAVRKYTYFFQTWVDKYGNESPVSEKSLVWSHQDGAYVDGDVEYANGDLVNIAASEKPDDNAITRRIYKVNSGTTTEQIQFVAEFSGALAWDAHDIEIRDEDLGETMESVIAPPSDLANVLFMPGGYYVGISATYPKSVMFSEIGEPYNWPIAYRYDIRDNLVAIAVTANTAFALTDGYPYLFVGTTPETMTSAVLANAAACVSKDSVCVFKNSVYYASNNGIAMIYNDPNEGTTVGNLTDKFFTKEQWQALNPASCKMRQYDNALHAFFKVGGEYKSYIFDLTETDCMMTTHDEHASCVCTDDETDTMYFVKEVQNG